LGKPDPGEMVVSEFDLDRAFKSYFGKQQTPGINGIAFGIDTSKAGGGDKGGAFIRTIEFFEAFKHVTAAHSRYVTDHTDYDATKESWSQYSL
jgi:hypothetical protein